MYKRCVWCLVPLEGSSRRWCKDDECIKAALAWARPQSPHGFYELMKRQDYSCIGCGISYDEYMDKAVSPNSKFYKIELHSMDIDLVMRRFKRLIPVEIRPEVDHIIPVGLGGTVLGLDNHQILCAICHKNKTKIDISEVRKGFDSKARIKSRQENLYPILRQPIIAINLITNEEIKFESLEDAAKVLGLQVSNISRVLNGKQNRKQHKGWTFRYQ
jgi:hypothetical protein